MSTPHPADHPSQLNQMLITAVEKIHKALNQIHTNFQIVDDINTAVDNRFSEIIERIEQLEANNDESTTLEAESEALAMGGMNALNESRGYDTTAPDPCGHQCPPDCPRCGEER